MTMKRDFDFDQCPPLTFHRNMLANSASVRILIKGGKVVNDDCTHEADVYIENGIIQQVGRELMIPGGAKVIDATGKLVIPGGIDTSTHFHQTFMNATCVDDFYHGTKVIMLLGAEGASSVASSVSRPALGWTLMNRVLPLYCSKKKFGLEKGHCATKTGNFGLNVIDFHDYGKMRHLGPFCQSHHLSEVPRPGTDLIFMFLCHVVPI